MSRDVHRCINELDEATIRGLVDRLEFRGKDPTFTRLRDAYLEKLSIQPSARVLELGCGTGVVARALARREGFSGQVVGVDQSLVLIEAACRLAADEGVGRCIEFHVGDARALEYMDASFDAVIAHTLVSHVTEPLTVLKEAARVVQPGGTAAIFDGDYASLTFACTDRVLGKVMDEAIVANTFTNPRVMRDLLRLLRQAGLELIDTLAHVYAEIGTGSYFPSFAETYAPLVSRAGLVPAEKVEIWLAGQRRALEQRTFFATCNYYTYLAVRPIPR